MIKKIFLFLLALPLFLQGAEYFVAVSGNDRSPGSEKAPWRTIAYGVNKLQSGDTLTIEPGRYFESVDIKRRLKNVTIRARFPGSVFLYGDKAAPRFQKVKGYRFVYVADWNENVQCVNERDTLKILLPAVNKEELEYRFGLWYKENGKLYVSSSDGQDPGRHDMTISVIRGYGLRLDKPENVRIEGLVIGGFYAGKQIDAWSGVSGLRISDGKNCKITDCRVFLCSNGFNFTGWGNVFDRCIAYANGSYAPDSGANFIGWGGEKNQYNVIRNSVSMFRQPDAGSTFGMRYYMGKLLNNRIENCVSFGEDGINVKGSNPENCWVINSYCERTLTALQHKNNVFGANGSTQNGYDPKDISPLRAIKRADWNKYYADPENHDFRSIKSVTIGLPKQIRSGETILLAPGDYPFLKISADNVTIKTRGKKGRARIAGALVSGKNVNLEQLVFSEPVKYSGEKVRFYSCEFQKSFAGTGKAAEVTHCKFLEKPSFANFNGFRHSNVGTPADVLDNGVSLDAFALGPCRWERRQDPPQVVGPFIHMITGRSAEIQWWTSRADFSGELLWGRTPKCENSSGTLFAGGFWHSVSLTGLEPGQKYYFRINSRTPLREHHANIELAVKNRQEPRTALASKVHSFTTLKTEYAPRQLKVTGNSISETLKKARPGDTVLIPGGTYYETLYVPVSNVTLRNVPGEKVWLKGRMVIKNAIVLENKYNVTIDGLFFKDFPGYAITIRGGQDITLKRCFYDGRSSNYTQGMIHGNFTENLTVSNCFITNGFYGSSFLRCKNLLIRNCVWFCNQINNFYLHNQPFEIATMRNNVFMDLIPGKIRNAPFTMLNLESLKESTNLYCWRTPESHRVFCRYSRIEGDPVSEAVNYKTYLEYSGQKRTSIHGNPDMPAVPRILTFKHWKDIAPGVMKMTDGYNREMNELGRLYSKEELKYVKGKPAEWNFADWFARNPECIRLNIGLEKELFTNGIPDGR